MTERDPYTDSGQGDQYTRRFPRGVGVASGFVLAIVAIGAMLVTGVLMRSRSDPSASFSEQSRETTGKGESRLAIPAR